MGPLLNFDSSEKQTDRQTRQSIDSLISLLSSWVSPLGYRIIQLEIQSQRQKTLRLFIDHIHPQPGQAIGIEDCVKVSRALDEPLENDPQLGEFFSGNYELEVSSPGLDRPLRSLEDFQEFLGKRARIHLFRPITAEESGNEEYQRKNPKQKNFVGILVGIQDQSVQMDVANQELGKRKAAKKVKSRTAIEKSGLPTGSQAEESDHGRIVVRIPVDLISKANLDPEIDFGEGDQ